MIFLLLYYILYAQLNVFALTIVYYNGALIVDNRSSLYIHQSIHASVTAHIIDVISQDDRVQISIEVEDKWFSNKELDYSSLMNVKTNPIVLKTHELKAFHASKILVANYQTDSSFLKRFEDIVNIITTDSGQLVQIMSKEASKEKAVALVGERLHITLQNIMVFGDDFNDLGLFKLCGYSVAMGNAIDELKQIATIITATNDNDGVAVVLEEFTYTKGGFLHATRTGSK